MSKGTQRESRWNLKWKMLGVILGGLLPMMVAVTILFVQTRNKMAEQYLDKASAKSERISQSIDEMLWNIYAVSDNFAYDEELSKYMNNTYGPEKRIYKDRDIRTITRQIFENYDLLRVNEKISAIYTYKGELFNFQDAGNDGADVIEKLEKLDINNPDKLMMLFWYPLQDDFLNREKTGELRKDRVIMGSRRIYDPKRSFYTNTHLFALEEAKIYERYEGMNDVPGAQVYILGADGSLLSSSEEAAVRSGRIDAPLKKVVLERTEDEFEWSEDGVSYRVYVSESQANDWLCVMSVPIKSITGAVDHLYRQIFLVIFICILFCSLMITHFYRSFMTPVAVMNKAMQDVNRGNLNAFVKVARQYEMGKMMGYYNDMLQSINTHVVEKLKNERRKKELEMEVLVSQINPHFLYNTLENIVWKSNEAGRPDIGRLAASLGRMYRLSASDAQIIRMQQEIEHLMAYVRIQKNRYGDSFEFDLNINMEDAREWYIPKLILQPIVENSFLYAFEGLERTLQIRVDMKTRRDWLEIRILDNGTGMSRERLKKVREQIKNGETKEPEELNRRSTGIGLHNVEARMELYFEVENALKIYSVEGKGTLTVLRIPKIKREDMEKWTKGQE